MVTPASIDSFQHQVLRVYDQGTVAADWYSQITDTGTTAPSHGGGNITFDTGVKRTADHACSLKLAHLAARGIQVRKTVVGANNMAVDSFYFRTVDATNPSGLVPLFIFGSTTNGWIRLNTSGQVTAQVGAGTTQTSATDYCDGQWHLIDAKYDMSTATGRLDVQVDGTALTQATGANSGTNLTDWNLGNTAGTVDYTIYYSDFVLSFTSGDYPIGDHICRMLEINGTGTHSKGSGAFQDEAGNTSDAELLNSVDDAWDGTTPGLSQTGEDFVQQTANDASGYLEFTLEDPAESTIWGAQLGVLMAAEDSTSANSGETRLVDSGGTTLVTTGLVDPSKSSTVYTGYRLIADTAPSGGWSGTTLGGCKVRVGFSDDTSPNPVWNSAIIEYVAPWTAGGTQYPQSVAATMTLTMVLPRLPKKSIASTATVSAALSRGARKLMGTTATLSAAAKKAVPKTIAAGVTAGATLLKGGRKILASTVTGTVGVATSKVKQVLIAAASTVTVALRKAVPKAMAVALTASASLARQVRKAMSIALTAAATLPKKVQLGAKGISSTITSGLTTQKVKQVALAVTSALGVALSRRVGKPVARSFTATVNLVRAVKKDVAITLSLAVAATKRIFKVIAQGISHTVGVVAEKIAGGGQVFYQTIAVAVRFIRRQVM